MVDCRGSFWSAGAEVVAFWSDGAEVVAFLVSGAEWSLELVLWDVFDLCVVL